MSILLAAAMAMTMPATQAGMRGQVEGRVADKAAEHGLVGMWYEAFVAPDGMIEDCHVRAVVGDADAAKSVCKTVIGRRAKPGTGPDGTPAYGWMIGSLTFADNYRSIPVEVIEPDIIITRANVGSSPERVDIAVLVGSDGKIASCEPREGAAQLTQSACAEVQTLALPVRTAKGGEAVPYIYPLIVEFRPESSS